MTSKAPQKRSSGFKHKWLALYGLQITSRDPLTSEVVSIKYRFCEFESDDLGGVKRKKTKHIKFYK